MNLQYKSKEIKTITGIHAALFPVNPLRVLTPPLTTTLHRKVITLHKYIMIKWLLLKKKQCWPSTVSNTGCDIMKILRIVTVAYTVQSHVICTGYYRRREQGLPVSWRSPSVVF